MVTELVNPSLPPSLVIGYVAVSQQLSPERVQGRLKPLFLASSLVVIAKLVMLVIAMVSDNHWTHSISSVVMYSVMSLLLLGLYTTTLYSLWATRSHSVVLRAISHRLLLISAYMGLHLGLKMILVSGGAKHSEALPFVVFLCSFMTLFQGAFDSMILGNLFNAATCEKLGGCCCYHKEATVVRRQTTDDRIRVGNSSITPSHSRCDMVPPPLPPPTFSSMGWGRSAMSHPSMSYNNRSGIHTSFLGLDDLMGRSYTDEVKSDEEDFLVRP